MQTLLFFLKGINLQTNALNQNMILKDVKFFIVSLVFLKFLFFGSWAVCAVCDSVSNLFSS